MAAGSFTAWDEDIDSTLAVTFGDTFAFGRAKSSGSSKEKPSPKARPRPKVGIASGAASTAGSAKRPKTSGSVTLSFLDKVEQVLLLASQCLKGLQQESSLFSTQPKYVSGIKDKINDKLDSKNLPSFSADWQHDVDSRGTTLLREIQNVVKPLDDAHTLSRGLKHEPDIDVQSMLKAVRSLESKGYPVHQKIYSSLVEKTIVASVADYDWERVVLTLQYAEGDTIETDVVTLGLYANALQAQLSETAGDEAHVKERLLAKELSQVRLNCIIKIFETLFADACPVDSNKLWVRSVSLIDMLQLASFAPSLDPIKTDLEAIRDMSMLGVSPETEPDEDKLEGALLVVDNTRSRFWKILNGQTAGLQLTALTRAKMEAIENDKKRIDDADWILATKNKLKDLKEEDFSKNGEPCLASASLFSQIVCRLQLIKDGGSKHILARLSTKLQEIEDFIKGYFELASVAFQKKFGSVVDDPLRGHLQSFLNTAEKLNQATALNSACQVLSLVKLPGARSQNSSPASATAASAAAAAPAGAGAAVPVPAVYVIGGKVNWDKQFGALSKDFLGSVDATETCISRLQALSPFLKRLVDTSEVDHLSQPLGEALEVLSKRGLDRTLFSDSCKELLGNILCRLRQGAATSVNANLAKHNYGKLINAMLGGSDIQKCSLYTGLTESDLDFTLMTRRFFSHADDDDKLLPIDDVTIKPVSDADPCDAMTVCAAAALVPWLINMRQLAKAVADADKVALSR